MSESAAIFQITLSRRVWRVTLDGAFYGDYRSRDLATESVDAAAIALRARGRVVKIAPPPESA